MEYEGSRREFLELVSQDDVPAFIRRAKDVEGAWSSLLAKCERDRQELLEMCRTRLAIVESLVGGRWPRLQGILVEPTEVDTLRQLFDAWKPTTRAVVEATDSASRLGRAVSDLARSMERFNRRWSEYLSQVDLSPVNDVREAYNKYYVIEKAAAFDSETIGREGFVPLEMLTRDDLMRAFPPLEVPTLR